MAAAHTRDGGSDEAARVNEPNNGQTQSLAYSRPNVFNDRRSTALSTLPEAGGRHDPENNEPLVQDGASDSVHIDKERHSGGPATPPSPSQSSPFRQPRLSMPQVNFQFSRPQPSSEQKARPCKTYTAVPVSLTQVSWSATTSSTQASATCQQTRRLAPSPSLSSTASYPTLSLARPRHAGPSWPRSRDATSPSSYPSMTAQGTAGSCAISASWRSARMVTRGCVSCPPFKSWILLPSRDRIRRRPVCVPRTSGTGFCGFSAMMPGCSRAALATRCLVTRWIRHSSPGFGRTTSREGRWIITTSLTYDDGYDSEDEGDNSDHLSTGIHFNVTALQISGLVITAKPQHNATQKGVRLVRNEMYTHRQSIGLRDTVLRRPVSWAIACSKSWLSE